MPTNAKCLFVVMMDVDEDKEADFNRVYDEEHIPIILKVPGVHSAARFKTSTEGAPKYVAIYEVEDASIPESEAFTKASDTGDWAPKIRPFTKNRSRIIYERI